MKTFKNSSILLFWNVMNLLPDRAQTGTGRSQVAEVEEAVDSINNNWHYNDYSLYAGDHGLSEDLSY